MRVVEIFKSIDGEGIRTGLPVTFIRLEGCNLRCSYCDTKYSYENPDYTEMTYKEIVSVVRSIGLKNITITGGEPLTHQDILQLVRRLIECNYEVNIETNGSVDISPFLYDDVIITADYKCPSSGMENKMILDNLKKLRNQDVLKFVVQTKEDLEVCRRLCKFTKATVFISPVFGKIQPKDIVDYVLANNMDNCRVQVQLHKIIWEPDARGV